jgi:hypothetical protein
MLEERKKAIDNISKILAITRYHIEHHQAISDYSLHIHGENYFRDVFNLVYDYKLINANFETKNAPCIDLIDKKRKLAYQITTTRTKEKIEKTLKILLDPKYKNYDIKIYFLLDKAKPSNSTIQELSDKYGITLSEVLADYTDLMRDIENLETNKLIELNNKYFKGIEKRYTDEVVLDLTCKHLLTKFPTIKKDYDDDFGSVDTNKKLELNKINSRTAAYINISLGHSQLLYTLNEEGDFLSQLRTLVIDNIYKGVLIDILRTKISKSELKDKNIGQLHELAATHQCDFNKIIHKLYNAIDSHIEIKDFNAMNIIWTIIAYFFEICDVGVHE